MSEHRSTLRWQRLGGDFAAKTYSRDHTLEFKAGQQLKASAAPAYAGSADAADPEEMLTAALSSCHMLTFLALAAQKGFTVESYGDEAVGVLEKNPEGRLALTRVTLSPTIIFAGTGPTEDELRVLHERAHRGCFVANSVKTEVTVAAV